jgi:hypothetical protein
LAERLLFWNRVDHAFVLSLLFLLSQSLHQGFVLS